MLTTEMILALQLLKDKHGDLPIILADRYAHYDIKRLGFSDACDGPHVCVRMEDSIKYDTE